MKNAVLIFIFFIASLSFAKAQTDICPGITKEYDDMQKKTTYSSRGLYGVQVLKKFYSTDVYYMIYFGLDKTTADYDHHNIYVKLSDSTIVTFPSAATCSYEESGKYDYSGIVQLTPDQLKKFELNKIVKFQIAAKEVIVDSKWAAKIEEYLHCLETIKQ